MGGEPGWQNDALRNAQASLEDSQERCKICEHPTAFVWPLGLCFPCWDKYKYRLPAPPLSAGRIVRADAS